MPIINGVCLLLSHIPTSPTPQPQYTRFRKKQFRAFSSHNVWHVLSAIHLTGVTSILRFRPISCTESFLWISVYERVAGLKSFNFALPDSALPHKAHVPCKSFFIGVIYLPTTSFGFYHAMDTLYWTIAFLLLGWLGDIKLLDNTHAEGNKETSDSSVRKSHLLRKCAKYL